MVEGIPAELIKELPSLIIFVLSLGWVIRKFHVIVSEYNKMIFEMSDQCRTAHGDIAREHRDAIRELVASNAHEVEIMTKMLGKIEDSVIVNRSRIEDIHEVVVKRKK